MLKPHFAAIMVAAFVICASPASAQLGSFFGSPKIDTISTEQLKTKLEKQLAREQAAADQQQPAPTADFVVVDVRSDRETAVSVIPGAITKQQFEKNADKYRDKTVIPYCTIGGRSSAYAKKLVGDGYKVLNYKGSILKWVDAELPLVTLDGEPTRRVHTNSPRYSVPDSYQQVTD